MNDETALDHRQKIQKQKDRLKELITPAIKAFIDEAGCYPIIKISNTTKTTSTKCETIVFEGQLEISIQAIL